MEKIKMVELHRCKVCGVLFGTEGSMTGHDASVCPSCQKKEDLEKEAAPVSDAR
jgi:rubrerythrin